MARRNSSSFGKVVIRCTRNNNSECDDSITIQPVWSNTESDEVKLLEYNVKFRTIYVEPSKNRREGFNEHETQFHNWGQVDEYLDNVLSLIALDSDPFQHIQFDVPLAPSIITAHKNLEAMIPRVLNLLSIVAQAWPTTYFGSSGTGAAAPAPPAVPTAFRAPSYTTSHYDYTSEDEEIYRLRRKTTPTPVARHLFFDEEDGEVIRAAY